MFFAQGSGRASRCSSARPETPKRSETGHGFPNDMRLVWVRFQHHPVTNEMKPEPGSLSLPAHLWVRKTDSRHEVAPARLGENVCANAIGLASQWRESLRSLGVSDFDVPAQKLETVVDEPGRQSSTRPSRSPGPRRRLSRRRDGAVRQRLATRPSQ